MASWSEASISWENNPQGDSRNSVTAGNFGPAESGAPSGRPRNIWMRAIRYHHRPCDRPAPRGADLNRDREKHGTMTAPSPGSAAPSGSQPRYLPGPLRYLLAASPRGPAKVLARGGGGFGLRILVPAHTVGPSSASVKPHCGHTKWNKEVTSDFEVFDIINTAELIPAGVSESGPMRVHRCSGVS
jgi:hypothetical protein